MNTRRVLKVMFASAVLLGCASLSFAQQQSPASFPNKHITMVVPWAPGGFTDVYARKVAEKMSHDLGQAIIVENRPGANGSIGTAHVARSAPDGYTIIVETADTHAINPSIYPPKDLKYDPIKDFKQIAILSSQPLILATNAALRANSVAEVVAMAKTKPDGLTYATWGKGSVAHLGIVRFAKSAGIQLTHIPYKGVAPAVLDVLAGRVDLMLTGIFTSGEYFKNGTMKPLAAASNQRLPLMPNLVTLEELGYRDLDLRLWYGLGVPSATPDAVVGRLYQAASLALQSADVKGMLEKHGMEIHSYTPAEATRHVTKERERWAAAAEAAGADLRN